MANPTGKNRTVYSARSARSGKMKYTVGDTRGYQGNGRTKAAAARMYYGAIGGGSSANA